MLEMKLDKLLSKESKKLKTLQFGMSIPDKDIKYYYSNTSLDQQFHTASVGKLMTATLIFMAIENKGLTLDSPISDYLDKDLLSSLFVYEGHDYQEEVTIKHLLSHTSGVNDYFESKTMDGSLFIDEVIENKDEFWIPEKLINFTRTRQKAIAKPGEKFMYSDTGYVLLGLIIEKVFGIPFHLALETYIFKPLDMNQTGLSFYSENFDPARLAPLYINGTDVRNFTSLSCDFSGGGIFTTTDDLLRFLKAFQEGMLISKNSIDAMARFENRFHRGIYYGQGLMETRFKEFFFLLGKLPNLRGHIGVTGAHAWYDPKSKGMYVLNVGNVKDMAKSFRLLIKIVRMVEKEDN